MEDSDISKDQPLAEVSKDRPLVPFLMFEGEPPFGKSRNLQTKLKTILEIVGVCAAVILVIITGLYTHYAKQQRDAILASNEINREALESVQRAFLTCRDIVQRRNTVHDKSGSHPVWSFTMPCDNTGTTPANVTAQGFFSATLPVEPTEEQFVAGRPLIQSVLIGPKANRNVGNFNATELSLFGVQLPDEGSDIVATPTIQTAAASNPHYFWGWVSYHDVFPKTDLHITEFCQVLAGISLDRSNASLPFGFGYIPCGHHNCADKYCEDYVSIVALAAKN